MSGIAIRMVKAWDLVESQPPVRSVSIPSRLYYPLAGHRGECAMVTTATVTGRLVACTCSDTSSA